MTSVWLLNLAVADLVFCCTRVPSLVKKLLLTSWAFSASLCKFIGLFKYANMFCSVFLLAVISLDRALCVWQPHLAKQRRTLRGAWAVAVGVWAAALLLGSPFCFYRNLSENDTRCSMDMDMDEGDGGAKVALYVIRFLCGFLLPFVVILVCYVLAGVGIGRTRLSGRSRPLRILASLVTAFFLCWAPYHCFEMAKMAGTKNVAVKVASSLAAAVAYFNSCINPLLYFCVGLRVRGRPCHSLTAVYRRALEDKVDRQVTLSNERSLDDRSARAAGSRLAPAKARLAEGPGPGHQGQGSG